ncbi:hypothetical protein EU538_10065 [Candidatus Thorarchaeota archaeon]|nr:MAG: hypothetical protein EU538_10065 [Candidatus Thorarchaeota archaeon]
MPEAVFIVQYDDYQGFLVKKRHPSTSRLDEETLNLLHVAHEEGDEELRLHDLDNRRYVSFKSREYPGWLVGYVLREETDFGPNRELYRGMSRLMLALMQVSPEGVDLNSIIRHERTLPELTKEQRLAKIYFTPSSALLLERLQEQGVESARALNLWLSNQVQTDNINIKEVVRPLLESGVVHVEIIEGKAEMVFLLRDIFGYRAPPVESLLNAKAYMPHISDTYEGYVKDFFSPAPPAKGYNPTIPIDEPDSPIMEDRERVFEVIHDNFNYIVLESLRDRPKSTNMISEETALPKDIVSDVLGTLESERIAVHFEDEKMWALVTDPTIKTFMPEYILPTIARRVSEKKLDRDAARRYLQLLMETWSEKND